MYIADALLHCPAEEVSGAIVEIDGERCYRVAGIGAMKPFLMSLISSSDHWLFISSNGALTAGRRDPDQSLFPYYTDDRIHDSAGQVGSLTILRLRCAGGLRLWQPFSEEYRGLYCLSRTLYKSVGGDKLLFEEINHDLRLAFRYEWSTSERFGFIRRASLENLGGEMRQVELIDGLQNVMPAGVTRRFQLEFSTLVDGYKQTELDAESGLAIFRLTSIPVDRAEPSEALRVNVAWAAGVENARHLLSTRQLARFRDGGDVFEEDEVRGLRGAYLLNFDLALTSGQRREWCIAADVAQDSSAVQALLQRLQEDVSTLPDEIAGDVRQGSLALRRMVASADGLQQSADALSCARHYSNTLYNLMRGGVPAEDYSIRRASFAPFVEKANREVYARHKMFLAAQPESIGHSELLRLCRERNDADLERLACEYLPLTFSRRHGDPSRPWNIFSIEVKDERGQRILNYQGNWRDIFQNWEALATSYPGYVESMIFKFLDASTADGYNPYRLTREGYEWEVLNPRDPWSYIGYWGDHQVVYLLKLLELSHRYHPGRLEELLNRSLFTSAGVPYRIKGYGELLRDPKNSIDFDADAHREALQRATRLGADGKALLLPDGSLYRETLAGKLLILVLTRLTNFIPEGGIWMNTQRPEWNDANNALTGNGVSVVTLCYLRRFLAFFGELLASLPMGAVAADDGVVSLYQKVEAALLRHASLLGSAIGDAERKQILDELGHAGESYRAALYAQGPQGATGGIELDGLRAFVALALRYCDCTIRANRREDGLYHAYNLAIFGENAVGLRRLTEMLEGQVAVLSSGALDAGDALSVLDALRQSALYRADLQSYLLYPDRRLPRFLTKNNLPASALTRSALLRELLRRGDRHIVVPDVRGGLHFHASLRNAGLLSKALLRLRESEPELTALVDAETPLLLELYEELFDHSSFTGRSGTFCKYEGLGCVYWHMVSKLLLAVEELARTAHGTDRERLLNHARQLRQGLGVHSSPAVHGAIPTEPYSHTPGFAGAQQPGMTGQVKEDILSRQMALGVEIQDGCVRFRPGDCSQEYLRQPAVFDYFALDGSRRSLSLEPGTLAFTLCQTPVVLHRSGGAKIQWTEAGGAVHQLDSLSLDGRLSRSLFEKTGSIERLDVFYPDA
jgi:hypothetical protein